MGFLERITQPKWDKSPAHLFLLSRFLTPHAVEDFTKEHQGWAVVLKENPRKSIKRFIDGNFIQRSDINGQLDYKFKLPELKEMLRARGQKVTGKKAILIERLLETDSSGMKELVKEIEVFECTKKGKDISTIYLNKEKQKKDSVEQHVFKALQSGDLEKACCLANAYHRQEVFFPVFSASGIIVCASNQSLLDTILSSKPKILGNMPEDQLKALQIAAGMKYLLSIRKVKDWLPQGFKLNSQLSAETAANMIYFHSNYENDLSKLNEIGIRKVRILVTNNACDHCQNLKDKKYDINDVPELPYENCTSEQGCRCTLVAALSSEDMRMEARK